MSDDHNDDLNIIYKVLFSPEIIKFGPPIAALLLTLAVVAFLISIAQPGLGH